MKKTFYTERFRKDVVTEYLKSGLSYKEVANKHGIPPGTLANWVSLYRNGGKLPYRDCNTPKKPLERKTRGDKGVPRGKNKHYKKGKKIIMETREESTPVALPLPTTPKVDPKNEKQVSSEESTTYSPVDTLIDDIKKAVDSLELEQKSLNKTIQLAQERIEVINKEIKKKNNAIEVLIEVYCNDENAS